MKKHAPATLRNREPILEVLRRVLPSSGLVLEVASGSGEHAAFFSAALPALTWQPTDPDAEALASIEAHRAERGEPSLPGGLGGEAPSANLLAPLCLDAASDGWGVARANAVVCINMIHISPWASCLGLFAGAARVLAPGAPLVLYGPFRFHGAFTAPSNEAFDASLRARDPAWGVRDVDDVTAAATRAGFSLRGIVALPANNHVLWFSRG